MQNQEDVLRITGKVVYHINIRQNYNHSQVSGGVMYNKLEFTSVPTYSEIKQAYKTWYKADLEIPDSDESPEFHKQNQFENVQIVVAMSPLF